MRPCKTEKLKRRDLPQPIEVRQDSETATMADNATETLGESPMYRQTAICLSLQSDRDARGSFADRILALKDRLVSDDVRYYDALYICWIQLQMMFRRQGVDMDTIIVVFHTMEEVVGHRIDLQDGALLVRLFPYVREGLHLRSLLNSFDAMRRASSKEAAVTGVVDAATTHGFVPEGGDRLRWAQEFVESKAGHVVTQCFMCMHVGEPDSIVCGDCALPFCPTCFRSNYHETFHNIERPVFMERLSRMVGMGYVADANLAECANCHTVGMRGGAFKLKKCTGCWSVWYCNRECQVADWRRHRRECARRT